MIPRARDRPCSPSTSRQRLIRLHASRQTYRDGPYGVPSLKCQPRDPVSLASLGWRRSGRVTTQLLNLSVASLRRATPVAVCVRMLGRRRNMHGPSSAPRHRLIFQNVSGVTVLSARRTSTVCRCCCRHAGPRTGARGPSNAGGGRLADQARSAPTAVRRSISNGGDRARFGEEPRSSWPTSLPPISTAATGPFDQPAR